MVCQYFVCLFILYPILLQTLTIKQGDHPVRDVKIDDSAVNHFRSSAINPDGFSHNDVTVHY